MTATELRTDELKPGMVVRLKSRVGTLPQNDWFTIAEIIPFANKRAAVLAEPDQYQRPFAAHTKWLVQEPQAGPATRILAQQRAAVSAMVRKGHAVIAA